MLNLYKIACLILVIAALLHAGLSAQIASAPFTSVTVPSRITNGVPQEAATGGKLQDLRIGIGDLLQVTMFGTQDFNADFRVSSSGDISLPPLGLVHVAGLSSSDAEKLIE